MPNLLQGDGGARGKPAAAVTVHMVHLSGPRAWHPSNQPALYTVSANQRCCPLQALLAAYRAAV